jgi:hypothetical protein
MDFRVPWKPVTVFIVDEWQTVSRRSVFCEVYLYWRHGTSSWMVAMTAVGTSCSLPAVLFHPSPLRSVSYPRGLVPSVLNPVVVSRPNTPMTRIPRRPEQNIWQFAGMEAWRLWGDRESVGPLGVFQGLRILEGGLIFHYLYKSKKNHLPCNACFLGVGFHCSVMIALQAASCNVRHTLLWKQWLKY